nr:unnamed protein product [Digitaria exilis]
MLRRCVHDSTRQLTVLTGDGERALAGSTPCPVARGEDELESGDAAGAPLPTVRRPRCDELPVAKSSRVEIRMG